MHKILQSQLQSRLITKLRFLLICGVLLMHTYTNIPETIPSPAHPADAFFYIFVLFSKIISHSSVPAFFFISGYLFFYKKDNSENTAFSLSNYREKLRRRCRTLLFPYIFWISAWLIGYFILFKSPLAKILHLGAGGTMPYSLQNIAAAFWCYNGDTAYQTFPLVGQFWFIRDLLVITLLSPLIWLAIRKIQLPFLLITGIFWLFDGHFPALGLNSYNIPLIGPLGLSHVVLFFFSLGAYFSINNKLFTEEFQRIRLLSYITYPLLVAATLFIIGNLGLKNTTTNWFYDTFWLHRLTVFTGVIFFINLIYDNVKKQEKTENNLTQQTAGTLSTFLASASFFVFAFHQEWLRLPAKKIFIETLSPQTEIARLACYIGHFLFYIILSLLSYALLKKLFPKFTNLITGGR